MGMQLWLVVTVDETETTTEVGMTTQHRGLMTGEGLTGGVSPDTLRTGLRISERLADFADQVRSA